MYLTFISRPTPAAHLRQSEAQWSKEEAIAVEGWDIGSVTEFLNLIFCTLRSIPVYTAGLNFFNGIPNDLLTKARVTLELKLLRLNNISW